MDSLTCLTVRDPRILLPVKKYVKPVENKKDTKSSVENKITKNTDSGNKKENSTLQRTLMSPLFFDSKIRDSVTLSKATNFVINKRRGNLPISGVTIPIDDLESRVPVLLSPNNHIDSLDILVPAGWAMPFWMCLVYNGCRVGGEKEFDHLQLEQSRPPLMYRYPDSSSGDIEAETRKEDLQKDYFAHPPLHRCSYPILGIASPFIPPWKILIKDWAAEDALINKKKPEIDSIHVMRDTTVISNLQQLTLNSKVMSSLVVSTADENCLVPVKLKIACRGRLGANSLICLPSRADLEEVVESGLWEGPVETYQQDDMEKQRKETIQTHKAQKKRLKRKWKKLKDKQTLMKCQSTALGKELDTEKLNHAAVGMATLKEMRNTENAAFAGKSEDLWIGDFNTVRNSCKREVMGYVTIGDLSYKEGCFVGHGFVTLKGARTWLQLLGSLDSSNSSVAKQARNLVLTRETSSPQYRFSYLEFV